MWSVVFITPAEVDEMNFQSPEKASRQSQTAEWLRLDTSAASVAQPAAVDTQGRKWPFTTQVAGRVLELVQSTPMLSLIVSVAGTPKERVVERYMETRVELAEGDSPELWEQLVAGGLLRLEQEKVNRSDRTPIFSAPASVPEAQRPVPRDCSFGNFIQIVMDTVGNAHVFSPEYGDGYKACDEKQRKGLPLTRAQGHMLFVALALSGRLQDTWPAQVLHALTVKRNNRGEGDAMIRNQEELQVWRTANAVLAAKAQRKADNETAGEIDDLLRAATICGGEEGSRTAYLSRLVLQGGPQAEVCSQTLTEHDPTKVRFIALGCTTIDGGLLVSTNGANLLAEGGHELPTTTFVHK